MATDVRPEATSWLLNWRIPNFLMPILPRWPVGHLRRLKGRVLSRGLPRHMEFKQSPEDALASAFMSVIIPIHDAPKATRRCLTSIEKYAPKSEVILVDDGSGLAETVALVRDFGNRNGWEVIRHETPLGHSAACAAGARLASRPYLCLLNSDTVVTPWCWRGLKEVFDSDQRIGVAGPSTSYSGNTQTLPLALGCRLYWNDSQICAFARDLAAGCPDPVWVDLAWASGFAFFVRRGLWEELGGFDANLTDYGNERELCRRVSELGYRSVWVRNSYIHHFGEQSYGTLGEETISSRKRAAERYIARKHGA